MGLMSSVNSTGLGSTSIGVFFCDPGASTPETGITAADITLKVYTAADSSTTIASASGVNWTLTELGLGHYAFASARSDFYTSVDDTAILCFSPADTGVKNFRPVNITVHTPPMYWTEFEAEWSDIRTRLTNFLDRVGA